MNTCKTCKHWEPSQEGTGVCLAANTSDGVLMQWIVPLQQPQYPPTYFFTSGAYGYEADLMVGPDFGCVHHNKG